MQSCKQCALPATTMMKDFGWLGGVDSEIIAIWVVI